MHRIAKGIYKHIKTTRLYEVVEVGRHVDNPDKFVVIYKQPFISKLHGTETVLPQGTIWIRECDDFLDKFVPFNISK